MDMVVLIKQRMLELGLGQKDVAAAAKVTESYISQLLTGKKAPPAPDRTDIYPKLERSLRLPKGRLSKLAELKRQEELKRKVMDPPAPLFKEARELILRKCAPEKSAEVRAIFEKQPFGEIERLITQKLLDVVQTLVREELPNEKWLRLFARISGRSYEEARVAILEFLDTDVFHVSSENCVAFLDPSIESWDIDFANFGISVVLNRRLGPLQPKRFEFVERGPDSSHAAEPGLEEFLADSSLSGDVSKHEIEFLRRLRFDGRRPTPLYFYRAIQNLRDPLHFRGGTGRTESGSSEIARRRRKSREIGN